MKEGFLVERLLELKLEELVRVKSNPQMMGLSK